MQQRTRQRLIGLLLLLLLAAIVAPLVLRSPEQVREDVLDDFCTVEHAHEAYGVVLNAELEIDAAATEARRGEMRG